MPRRLACLAVALLLSGCSIAGLGPPPDYGFVTITTGGVGLHGGDGDVPPTLDLRLHADVAFRSGDVTATLDGRALTLTPHNGDLVSSVPPLALASAHRLAVAVAGMSTVNLSFTVVPPTAAMLAAHIDPRSGLVVDAVFASPPSQAGVAAALPGATLTWSDGDHARVTWHATPPASIALPVSIATAGDAHLDPGLQLDLTGIGRNTVRRVTVPPAPTVGGTPITAFVINTATSNSSLAFHLGALHALSATGWEAQADGSILGTPDPSAVSRALAAGVAIYPSLTNDTTDPQATDQLLTSAGATSTLIGEMTASVADAGFAGVNLDFEGMLAADKAPFTAFVQKLASALHAHGARLIVDVVPHSYSGLNAYSVAYDVPAIGRAADLVDLMAYDQHGDGGTPGPVAGLDWDRALLAATMVGLRPAHTLLGIPLYGREWGTIGGASAFSNVLYNGLSVAGARVDYDFAAQTPYIVSPDATLISYFDDADSLARKIALARSSGLAGVAAWRLGFEDPAFWSLFGG